MDLSFEKTNSAYMLFYEKKQKPTTKQQEQAVSADALVVKHGASLNEQSQSNDDLMKSIWLDNIKFMNDKQILEHAFFNFAWQMCDYVPKALISSDTSSKGANEINGHTNSSTSLILATKLGEYIDTWMKFIFRRPIINSFGLLYIYFHL